MLSAYWQTLGSGFSILSKSREIKDFILGLRERPKQRACALQRDEMLW